MTWRRRQTGDVILYLYKLDLLITVLNYQEEKKKLCLETGCRPVSSPADLEDKEFSSGTRPRSDFGCGTFPQPQLSHRVG